MDLSNSFGFNSPIFSILEDMLDFSDEQPAEKSRNVSHNNNNPSRAYVRDAKAMAATPADVIEYPSAYAFIVDMPGIKAGEIKVAIENDNVLVVSGERKREANASEAGAETGDDHHDREKRWDGGGVRYLRMERRMGKFMRKFRLPENANVEAVAAECRDGVLTVRVEKLPPPEPKRPKTIQVNVA